MEKIGIDTWLTLLGMLAAVVIFLFKGASKVEKNDLSLAHEVEENRANLEKMEVRVGKIETFVAEKQVNDALLNQKVAHILETVDEIKSAQTNLLSQALSIISEYQRKGGSL